MDHVMEKIENYYPIYLDEFLDEQVKHNYKKLSDNPVYQELKIIIDSINLFRRYLELPELRLGAEVKIGIKRRNVNEEIKKDL